MNNLSINIDDYISEEEKREIAITAFKEIAAETTKKDFERILYNANYQWLTSLVDEYFDGDIQKAIKEKALSAVNKLSSFDVFKKPDAWDRGSSKAWVYLQEVLSESKPLIQEKVEKIIQEMEEDQIRENLHYAMGEVLIDKLVDAVLKDREK